MFAPKVLRAAHTRFNGDASGPLDGGANLDEIYSLQPKMRRRAQNGQNRDTFDGLVTQDRSFDIFRAQIRMRIRFRIHPNPNPDPDPNPNLNHMLAFRLVLERSRRPSR